MKKINIMFLLSSVLLVTGLVALTLSGCTKEGPEGPPGEDANATCGQCHDVSDEIHAIQVQYGASTHAMGSTFERNGSDCAVCHTSQGFGEFIETGSMTTANDIDHPTNVNCRTCHKIHTSYTAADYDLTYDAAITAVIDGATIDMGDGNLCAACHQARLPSPLPEMGGGDVTVTSPYWGVHHGPQSNLMYGSGGYEFTGSASYPTPGAHAHYEIEDGCITCHMASPYGAQAGGHTWNASYLYHGQTHDLIAGCTSCHSTLESFDYNGAQTDIQALIDDVGAELLTLGLIDEDNHIVPGTHTADDAGAVLNYLYILEDRSLGIHNPAYAEALLTNTLEYLQAK